MKVSLLTAVLALTICSVSVAEAPAQTANSTPTAPANTGASGSSATTSTTGPSTGDLQLKPGTSKIGAPTEVEKKEQAKSDKVINICKGC